MLSAYVIHSILYIIFDTLSVYVMHNIPHIICYI